MCQRLQAFRHDTFLQIASFTRTIDKETEKVQLQLAPPPPGAAPLPQSSSKRRAVRSGANCRPVLMTYGKT